MPEYPTTNNHDFARPEPGTLNDNWGTVINEELIDLLEESVVVRDREAERSKYTPYSEAIFLSTDTGIVYLGDGSEWEYLGTIGKTAGAAGIEYAANHAGDNLSQKVLNALNALPGGQGKVVVTAREDGRPWQWGETLSLTAWDYHGVEIEFDRYVKIEYSGSENWLFDLTGTTNTANGGDYRSGFKITGGIWDLTDAAGTGWIRLENSCFSHIGNARVEGASTGFYLTNSIDGLWSECTTLSELSFRHVTNYGVHLANDGGNISLDHTQMEYVYVSSGAAGMTAFYLGPDVIVNSATWTSLTAWLDHSDTTGVSIDGHGTDAVTIMNPKIEDTSGGTATGQTGFFMGSSVWRLPVIFYPVFFGEIDNSEGTRYDVRANHPLPVIGQEDVEYGPTLRAESSEGSVFRVNDQGQFSPGGSARSSEPSGEEGWLYLDDGTNRRDGQVGLRYHDGSTWIDI